VIMNLQAIINTIRQWFSEPQASPGFYYQSETDLDDITTYASTKDIFASGRFSPEERRREYIRRDKSPSGVIDGEYNDMYLEDGASYNDMDRDWEADA
ncbi:hypothetical protein ACFLXI_04365, partial [Chloroflexota bacterium]